MIYKPVCESYVSVLFANLITELAARSQATVSSTSTSCYLFG